MLLCSAGAQRSSGPQASMRACTPEALPLPLAGTITSARLVNGTSPSEGRLEVQYHGAVWGTVCSSGFDTTAAAVACREAGFAGGGAVLPTSAFGPGAAADPILIGAVSRCANSSLASLADCSLSFDASDCDHGMDVGLACQGAPAGGRPASGGGA